MIEFAEQSPTQPRAPFARPYSVFIADLAAYARAIESRYNADALARLREAEATYLVQHDEAEAA